ncbi:MAG: hypothetical protein AYK22_04675 [Thermoplasmatales archaeon SG8-52-3]|nr:MAG: hypothetical protein AYK22_04675 [Thermoplasmatales archaeon SG8-52-3]
MSKKPVLYKSLVVGVIVLFIGMSVVSSTGNNVDDIPSNTQNLNTEDSSKDLHYRGDYGYAYNAYPGPEGTVYFPLDDPGNITECGETVSGDFLAGGTIDSDGIWYAVQYGNGLLFGIDTNNGCDMWSIGGGGETALLYIIIDSYNLYWYDPETGEGDYLGNIDVSLTQIEFDNNDILYGFELSITGDVYTIDLSTFETTLVGTLTNITSTGGLSIAFDKDTNDLYLLGTGLYVCDTETYKCTLIGGYPMGVECTSFVIPYGNDDTTPPVTTYSLDPPEPDGNNGWYVSDVNVTLNATDDFSGVEEIRYTINGGAEHVITGDNGSFILSEDGDDILIEYWAIDNADNVETPKNSFIIDIDQTEPDISLTYYITGWKWGWNFEFTAEATDYCSGMERVEFYMNDMKISIIYGSGPIYTWKVTVPGYPENTFNVRGLIYDLHINDDFVKFKTLIVRISKYYQDFDYLIIRAYAFDKAGNIASDEIINPENSISITPGIYIFKSIILPNNYIGHIGNNFISATFNTN